MCLFVCVFVSDLLLLLFVSRTLTLFKSTNTGVSTTVNTNETLQNPNGVALDIALNLLIVADGDSDTLFAYSISGASS